MNPKMTTTMTKNTNKPPRMTRFTEELYNPLIALAAAEFSVTPAEVFNTRRKHRESSARYVSMTLMRVFFDVSYDEVGYVFGLTHSSAIHGVSRVEHDPILKEAATRVGKKFAVWLTKEGHA